MPLNAQLSVNPNLVNPNQNCQVILSLQNPTGAALNVTGIQPMVLGSTAAAMNWGMPPVSQGQTISVPANGSLNIYYNVVPFGPSFIHDQQPGPVIGGVDVPLADPTVSVYSLSATVSVSDGTATIPTTCSLNVAATKAAIPAPPLPGQLFVNTSPNDGLLVVALGM